MTTLSQNVKVKVFWRLTVPLKVISFSYCQGHHTRNRNPIEHKPKKFEYLQLQFESWLIQFWSWLVRSRFFVFEKISGRGIGQKIPNQKIESTDRTRENPYQKTQTTDRNKKSGSKIQNTDQENLDKKRTTDRTKKIRTEKSWSTNLSGPGRTGQPWYRTPHNSIKFSQKNLPMKQASNIEIISFLNFSSQIVKIEIFLKSVWQVWASQNDRY